VCPDNTPVKFILYLLSRLSFLKRGVFGQVKKKTILATNRDILICNFGALLIF